MKLTIFDNWHDGVKALPEPEQDAFYGAVARYMFDGAEPSLEGIAGAVWAVVQPMLDTSKEGQENGAKGGNGRGNKTPSENPPSKPPAKRGAENQKKGIEGKGREREGFQIPEKFENHSHGGNGAAAEGSAPPPPDETEIFEEVDRLYPDHPSIAEAFAKKREADARLAELEAGAAPCPFGDFSSFKAAGEAS